MWCKPHVALETGAAAEAIVRAAHERAVDLIVMGVHSGGTVATHLPWTVVHSVVRHSLPSAHDARKCGIVHVAEEAEQAEGAPGGPLRPY